MAATFTSITPEQEALIARAPMFFVASADPALEPGPHGVGPVNVSPRGAATLMVLSPNRVAFLDYRGSGNETARHAALGGPVTLMVCSFEGEDAAIVRLYGRAQATPAEDSPLTPTLLQRAPEGFMATMRQVIEVEVSSTMTSCGYGVPVMELVRQRRKADRGGRFK